MNFKTPIILLVLLVGVGAYIVFTTHGSSSSQTVQNTNPTRILDTPSSDVTKLTISPADGTPIVLERSTQSNTPQIGPAVSDWKITSPAAVYADQSKVSDLLDALTTANSTAQVAIGSNAADYGLDTPQYSIEIDAGMKTAHLDIGRQEQAGNELYVRVSGSDQAQVIGADLLDQLSNATVEKLRLPRLVNADSGAVNWVQIDRPADPLTLVKVGGTWQMSVPGPHPTTEPAEQSSVTDLLSQINSASAVQFAPDGADPAKYIGTPTAIITYSSQDPSAASTQPATTETIEFGLPDSLLAKNVWIHAVPPSVLATISRDTANSILKSSLDLRDRNVVQIIPADVTGIRIVKAAPAMTQPVKMAASLHQTVLERRPPQKPVVKKAGPPRPTTQPAATQPSSVWVLTQSRVHEDADDSKVDSLLSNFSPLRVDKYLAAEPSSSGQTTYIVTLTMKQGEPVTIVFTDPGIVSDTVNGICGKLNFSLPRAVITALDSDFTKSTIPAAP